MEESRRAARPTCAARRRSASWSSSAPRSVAPLLAAALQTLALYRGGILVQSDAAVRSTLAQYQVGKVTFPSVLEVLRGLVVDEGGYLDALAAAQRVAIADREVSLAPPGGLSGGARAAASRGRLRLHRRTRPASGAPPAGLRARQPRHARGHVTLRRFDHE